MACKWKLPATWALIALLLSTAIIISLPNVGHHSKAVERRGEDGRTSRVNGTRRLWDRSVESAQWNPNNVAPDDMWNKYKDKGAHLQCLMQATDAGAGYLTQDTRNPPSAASQWSGDWTTNLLGWFWHSAGISQEANCNFQAQGLGRAFAALGLNALPMSNDQGQELHGDNFAFAAEHFNMYDRVTDSTGHLVMRPILQQKYTVNNKEYTATGAHYEVSINEVDGAIVALDILSPAQAVDSPGTWNRPAAPGELPELRFFSDIMWAFWVTQAEEVDNLRVYMAHNVQNTETNKLVARAFQGLGITALPVWPGQAFDANSDAGRALIGSPIGAPLAIMLIQRKHELGVKQISRITVCTNDVAAGAAASGLMFIFFEIENVPQGEITDNHPHGKRSGKSGLMEPNAGISQFRNPFNDTRLIHVQNEGRDILAVHTLRL